MVLQFNGSAVLWKTLLKALEEAFKGLGRGF
jgi:hypothetical protein